MRQVVLNIGDYCVTRASSEMLCYGLGSCVGVFIRDRVAGISGGAHIFLPEGSGGESVKDILGKMLAEFQLLGSSLLGLRAKITGGAELFECSFRTGQRNTETVKEFLLGQKIYLAAADTGSNGYRTARYYSATDELFVKYQNQNVTTF